MYFFTLPPEKIAFKKNAFNYIESQEISFIIQRKLKNV